MTQFEQAPAVPEPPQAESSPPSQSWLDLALYLLAGFCSFVLVSTLIATQF